MTPEVANAYLTHRLLSAANTVNATLVKGKPGTLLSLDGFNAGTISYLKLYDTDVEPTEAMTPRRTIYLPANLRFQLDWRHGLAFSSGIGYRLTTAGADNSTAAVASAAVLAMNIDYN